MLPTSGETLSTISESKASAWTIPHSTGRSSASTECRRGTSMMSTMSVSDTILVRVARSKATEVFAGVLRSV